MNRTIAVMSLVALAAGIAIYRSGWRSSPGLVAMLATPPCLEEGTGLTPLFPIDRDHALPPSYVPQGLIKLPRELVAGRAQCLERNAAVALALMLTHAEAEGQRIKITSGFRDFAEQERTYWYWAAAEPQTFMREVALPGHSEHQLGTTVDLTARSVRWQSVSPQFGASPEGQWLAKNAAAYGFVMSYPEGKEAVTGYAPEAWHYRYVGKDTAALIAQRGITLKEYLAASSPLGL